MHARSCPAYGNYQPPYEECDCGEDSTPSDPATLHRALDDAGRKMGTLDVGEKQPLPVVRQGASAIQDLVIADIERRKVVGLKKYGTLLQAFNGRDALQDLYEELLDAAQYIRQLIEERREHEERRRSASGSDTTGRG